MLHRQRTSRNTDRWRAIGGGAPVSSCDMGSGDPGESSGLPIHYTVQAMVFALLT